MAEIERIVAGFRPHFQYRELTYAPSEMQTRLETLKADIDAFEAAHASDAGAVALAAAIGIYRGKCEMMWQLNAFNALREGDRAECVRVSELLFGAPTAATLAHARWLLTADCARWRRPSELEAEQDDAAELEEARAADVAADAEAAADAGADGDEDVHSDDLSDSEDGDDLDDTLSMTSTMTDGENVAPPIDAAVFHEQCDVEARVVRKALLAAIRRCQLPPPWGVKWSKRRLTACSTVKQTILVCRDRLFSPNAPRRLGVHEVGVHATRGANAMLQPLGVFRSGTLGYMETEEGMAAFCEELAQVDDRNTMHDYAARCLVVHAVRDGLSFTDAFLRLLRNGVCCERAWNVCVRSFRGGGYLKDHCYLQGYLRVAELARTGSLIDLFAGKYGLDDLDAVRTLIKHGLMKRAVYVPWFVKGGFLRRWRERVEALGAAVAPPPVDSNL